VSAGAGPEPAAWLTDHVDLLPRGGRVLDVACGRGRNALWLAGAGYEVRAIDRDAEAIGCVRDTAMRLGLVIDAQVVDLETDPPPVLGDATYDAVLVFNYLHRPLMSTLCAAVKPSGRLFYETFTTRQAERGHPRNPAFLLRDGELAELVAPFRVLRSREGDIDGRFVASIVAQRAAGAKAPALHFQAASSSRS
jgi:SAM-dependent methyltransferase